MPEVKLQYLGKKVGVVFENSALTRPVPLDPGNPICVPECDAEWLMGNNPSMFIKLDERNDTPEEMPDIEVLEEGMVIVEGDGIEGEETPTEVTNILEMDPQDIDRENLFMELDKAGVVYSKHAQTEPLLNKLRDALEL